VIVPFAGPRSELEQLVGDLGHLRLDDGDEVIVADNRVGAEAERIGTERVRVCPAEGVRAPGFARNRGAEVATGEWLLFIDADTEPEAGLLDEYFDPPPPRETAVLAGGIVDVGDSGSLAARHSAGRGQMDQRVTFERAGSPYAQTANCAVRRSAFVAVGGFDERIRSGEDADLCFRLARAGWRLEQRYHARVTHQSRDSLGALLRQLARHGSGAAWLNRRYPGEFPPPRPRELAGLLAGRGAAALRALTRGDLRRAGSALMDLLSATAFDLGRLRSNRAPSAPER
jgi:mycofactocin glycosyltransferase